MGGGGKGGSATPEPRVYYDSKTGRAFTDDPLPLGNVFTPADGKNPLGSPGFQSGAQKLNAFIDQRDAEDKVKSDAAAATAATDKSTAHTDWLGKKDRLIGQERDLFNTQFSSQGLDPNAFQTDIESAINKPLTLLKDDADLTGLYSSSAPNDLITTLTGSRQSKNLADFNKLYDPATYADKAVQSTWGDPITDKLLTEQFDPVTAALKAAKDRGQLNDQGYTGAMNEFNAERSAGKGQIHSIVDAVLGNDRNDLNAYLNTGRDAAGKTPLNSQFTLDPYTAGVSDRTNRYQSALEGDVRGRVGGTTYADLNKIMNAGGTYQGPIAPGAAPAAGDINGAIAANVLDPTKKRATGTEGPGL